MAHSYTTLNRALTMRAKPALASVIEQRGECAANERADCTVIALSIGLGIPYDVAYRMLEAAGRRPNHGFGLSAWLRGKSQIGDMLCGYKVTSVHVPWLTLTQVRHDFPKGRFIVRKRGHVFAMLDGVVLDMNGAGGRTLVTDLFLLERV